jgi:hypothetical protein
MLWSQNSTAGLDTQVHQVDSISDTSLSVPGESQVSYVGERPRSHPD